MNGGEEEVRVGREEDSSEYVRVAYIRMYNHMFASEMKMTTLCAKGLKAVMCVS